MVSQRYDALLIDTFSAFFRAYYALPTMNTSRGEPTQALYGFSVLLLKLLRDHEPQGTAFALDVPGGTFRHRAFDGYKGTRSALPDDLVTQLRSLERLTTAFGFPVFGVPDFEADDVLATLSQELAESQVLIASGDRDLLQLVDARTDVMFLGQRGKPAVLYDLDRVRARFKLEPAQLPAYVALVGDPSDNIPKIKGVGPVAAQKLVAQYGDISSLLAQLDELPARTRELLAPEQSTLRLNAELTRLRPDVPLPEGVRLAALDDAAVARVEALFLELEFKSLIPRLHALGVRSSIS